MGTVSNEVIGQTWMGRSGRRRMHNGGSFGLCWRRTLIGSVWNRG
jgi:hypothetical protein